MTDGSWGSCPRPPRKIDEKVASAYRAAGWDLTPGGKPIPPTLGKLRPDVPPPGNSRLPRPNRRWGGGRRDDNRSPSEVPPHAKTLSEVPEKLRQAYDYLHGVGYKRTIVGDALAEYRNLKRADPYGEPLTKRRSMTQEQYSLLQALAEPGAERQHFQRAAATKRIRIED
jgi:hypothetical protein